jgi:hypothetical protein
VSVRAAGHRDAATDGGGDAATPTGGAPDGDVVGAGACGGLPAPTGWLATTADGGCATAVRSDACATGLLLASFATAEAGADLAVGTEAVETREARRTTAASAEMPVPCLKRVPRWFRGAKKKLSQLYRMTC